MAERHALTLSLRGPTRRDEAGPTPLSTRVVYPRPVISRSPALPLLPLLPLTLLACAAAAPPAPPAPPPAPAPPPPPREQAFAPDDYEVVFTDPQRKAKIASTFPAIDALVEAHVRDKKLPSTVLGIVVDGALVHTAAFGVIDVTTQAKPDADTLYRIGSITKSFTALALLALRDEGALSLDDPLSRFVPEAHEILYPTRDTPPITLRQVLHHRAGLPRMGRYVAHWGERATTERELVEALSGLTLERAPGTEFLYSNFGHSLLGLVVGRASKSSLRGFVGAKVLAPLGMTSTVWDTGGVAASRVATPYHRRADGAPEATKTPDLGATEGSGGLYSSLRDMARYAAFQLAAYPPRSEPDSGPVRRSSVREGHTLAIKSSPMRVTVREDAKPGDSAVKASTNAYGFAWGVAETCDIDRIVGHNGAIDGYVASIQVLPERGVGVISLANMYDDRSSPDNDRLSMDVLRLLAKSGGLSKHTRRMKALPAAFDAVMPKLLAVQNRWSEEGYRAMLTQGRKVPSEKDELGGYHATHGDCKGYVPLEVSSPREARFALQCERGALEMEVRLGADGLLAGFTGTSREVPAKPALAAIASTLAGLVGTWSDAAYEKVEPSKAPKPRAEVKASFERLRATHGSCKVTSYSARANKPRFELACARGGGLQLALDPEAGERPAFSWSPAQAACPIK